MARFAKFDPRAFLERKKRASENAGVQQTPEDTTPPASKTLATLATLAASASQNEKLDFVQSSADHHHHRGKKRKSGLPPAKVAKVAKVFGPSSSHPSLNLRYELMTPSRPSRRRADNGQLPKRPPGS